jgi:ketosteroid isomerase-like protein
MNSEERNSPTQSDIKNWFRALERCVRTVDYASARPLFAPDVVAFGTRAEVVSGLDYLQENQWSGVWPFIKDFTFDLSQLRLGWSGEGGWAVATWTSTGFRPDGTPFQRPGRATVAFGRRDGHLVALHTHFSLYPTK